MTKIKARPYVKVPMISRMMPNFVLVKIDKPNKESTIGGVYIASGTEDDQMETDDVYDIMDRVGTVAMLPPRLNYNPFEVQEFERVNETFNSSLEWDTDLEIKIGDTVWMKQIDANCTQRWLIDGEKYKLIKYDALIVAKRGDEIIPLNGFVLLEPVTTNVSELIITTPKPVKEQGIIKYIGSKNKDYKSNWVKRIIAQYRLDKADRDMVNIHSWSDDIDVKAGDKIQYDMIRQRVKEQPEVWLESDLVKRFGEKLKIIQRRHIIGLVDDDYKQEHYPKKEPLDFEGSIKAMEDWVEA